MNVFEKLFPSVPQRIHRRDAFWNGKKKPYAIAITASSVMLLLAFFVNICYLLGSLHGASKRVSNLNVLMVDYDGGVIGKSMLAAANSLAGPTFPSVHAVSESEYPTSDDLFNAVYKGQYWAAIYTHPNASTTLSIALRGDAFATFYNTSAVITYIWNEARYAAPSNGYLKSSLEQLVQMARISYNHINGTGALQTLNQNDPAALQVLLTPWTSSSVNIQPTHQGDRVLYNTVIMVLPIIMQFFALMAMNNLSQKFSLYTHLSIQDNSLIRLGVSTLFTFTGALFFTLAIWAFKETWSVTGIAFWCTWLALWLYMHVNFLVLDTATAFLPSQALSFFVLTWVVLNVSSTIFPVELSPALYRLGYAFPAHETWLILMQVFSKGATGRLGTALPVLFVWEILGLVAAKAGMHSRCVRAARVEREVEERIEARMLENSGIDGKEMLYQNLGGSVSDSLHELHKVETEAAK